ncbi:YwmB family TATA-box binding protein [Anaerophilus nitritogenes]|uniref:YwmB family TATA-box binding protein n=1 Tax=Anaerophilus nitritogenes TaxID=2498136 RepID=UPI00101CB303|nr:YwmB family TATA-box binding protein [Anaerophilus nitritogenes]
MKKIIKKICLYSFILILCFIFTMNRTDAFTKEEGILKAFEISGGNLEEINLNGHTNIKKYTDPKEGKKIALHLSKQLLMTNPQILDTSEQENTQIYIQGKTENKEDISLIIQSIKNEHIKETNIVVDVIYDKIIDIHQETENIKKILNYFGTTTFTSCITGSYVGKLEGETKEQIITDIMKNLKIKEIEKFDNKDMISTTGYSSKIKDHISYGGNKVNMHLAIRYNSYDQKTYIWIGTPLIAIGY